MENCPTGFWSRHAPFLLAVIFVLLAVVGLAGYWTWHLNQQIIELENEAEDLRINLNQTEDGLASTTEAWQAELARNNFFTNQLTGISGKVEVLDKLRKIDPELLRKYSKVYFLSENYDPPSLTDIAPIYLDKSKEDLKIRSEVWPFLQKLLDSASSSGNNLLVISAFRSFNDQKQLKSGYQVTYGYGANKFSADQGYSEHQLGTTIDFTTSELETNFSNFGKTKAYQWLKDNAHRYGFVLSYPEDNDFYEFEPWHWRFVGVKLATYLHEQNKNFYTFSQREISSYLVNIFDLE